MKKRAVINNKIFGPFCPEETIDFTLAFQLSAHLSKHSDLFQF